MIYTPSQSSQIGLAFQFNPAVLSMAGKVHRVANAQKPRVSCAKDGVVFVRIVFRDNCFQMAVVTIHITDPLALPSALDSLSARHSPKPFPLAMESR